MTAAEYLAWEREQADKHEFHEGEVFAMAGGTLRHNFLGGRTVAQLWAAMGPLGCIVLSSDQRVVLEEERRYAYPDAVVVCGTPVPSPGTKDTLTNPTVIVEVLSPGTEAFDRGDKWAGYRRLPSLTDYLLVSQESAQIEHFQRATAGAWHFRALGPGDEVVLTNGARLSVDAVFAGAFELPGAEPQPPPPPSERRA